MNFDGMVLYPVIDAKTPFTTIRINKINDNYTIKFVILNPDKIFKQFEDVLEENIITTINDYMEDLGLTAIEFE